MKDEALRLADALRGGVSYDEAEIENELRRLHAVEADFHMAYRMKCDAQTKVLHAQRDALLALLKEALDVCIWPGAMITDLHERARAAIKAVEEGK